MTREQQIELMIECLDDAHEAFRGSGYDGSFWDGNGEAAIAAAFFQYRAGQRDAGMGRETGNSEEQRD